MAPKRVVLDANILIRAVLGRRVRQLLENYCETVDFYAAEANADEGSFYLAEILAKKYHLSDDVWHSVWENIMSMVHIVPTDTLVGLESKAKARIAPRDINDWPAVAVALLLECPVWTEDRDFLGSGVATWTTSTIELYLTGQ